MWHLTRDTWHVTPDTWHVTPDTWHVTRDMWHVTYDTWWGVNILSKFQLPSSYGLGVMIIRSFGGKGSLTESINEWINDKGDCRTAPATPGLLVFKTTNILGVYMTYVNTFKNKNILKENTFNISQLFLFVCWIGIFESKVIPLLSWGLEKRIFL